jgi:hypothetical protein
MAQKKKAAKKGQSATASLEKWARGEIQQLAATVAKLQKDLERIIGGGAAKAKPAVKRAVKKTARTVGAKKAAVKRAVKKTARTVGAKKATVKRAVRAKKTAVTRAVGAKKAAVTRKPARRRPARKPTARS